MSVRILNLLGVWALSVLIGSVAFVLIEYAEVYQEPWRFGLFIVPHVFQFLLVSCFACIPLFLTFVLMLNGLTIKLACTVVFLTYATWLPTNSFFGHPTSDHQAFFTGYTVMITISIVGAAIAVWEETK